MKKWLVNFVLPERKVKAKVSDELRVILQDVDASRKLIDLVLEQDHNPRREKGGEVEIQLADKKMTYDVSSGSEYIFSKSDILRK